MSGPVMIEEPPGLTPPLARNDGEANTAPGCYCHGTRILTDQGEVFVEDLCIGDVVVTGSGELHPVRWIGRRSYAGRFLAANPAVQPVQLRAGALGHGLPHRDLFLSPEHALLLDGLLIPARCLVNGTSILPLRELDQVDYVHIELAKHDVIVAEGALAETFLDVSCRGIFHNAAEYHLLYPDAPAPGRYYAPRTESGYELEAIRQRLARTSPKRGFKRSRPASIRRLDQAPAPARPSSVRQGVPTANGIS